MLLINDDNCGSYKDDDDDNYYIRIKDDRSKYAEACHHTSISKGYIQHNDYVKEIEELNQELGDRFEQAYNNTKQYAEYKINDSI